MGAGEPMGGGGIATQPAGVPARRYGLSRWVALLVAQGDERAAPMLEELRSLLDGFPVETQFHNPFRVAVAEDALWRGDPEAALGVGRRRDSGRQRIVSGRGTRCGSSVWGCGPRRTWRRSPARDATPPARRPLSPRGGPMGGGSSRHRLGHRSPSAGVVDEEHAAEIATVEAERARLLHEPAADALGRGRASAGERRTTRTWSPTARWRHAEALLGDGERASAAAALVEAYRIATGLGARPLTAHIEALAARSRLDLSPDHAAQAANAPTGAATADDPFGLTRRERDVLPLLVKGRTNRQIAEELFISENTAGVHVSNILGKLGATTRTEAAGIAARLGLGTE